MLATGDYSRKLNHRFFQLGSISRDAPWRELLTGLARDKMGGIRTILGELLDQINESEQPIRDQLYAISSQWLTDREAQGIYDWRTYFVKYPAMREGESGRYAGWDGKLGYLVCMLRGNGSAGTTVIHTCLRSIAFRTSGMQSAIPGSLAMRTILDGWS